MAAYLMFGEYSSASIQRISAKRTRQALNLIAKCQGRVLSMYALMGQTDLVLIVEFPGNREALKASLAISRLTGISFHTSPAITVEDLDSLAGKDEDA